MKCNCGIYLFSFKSENEKTENLWKLNMIFWWRPTFVGFFTFSDFWLRSLDAMILGRLKEKIECRLLQWKPAKAWWACQWLNGQEKKWWLACQLFLPQRLVVWQNVNFHLSKFLPAPQKVGWFTLKLWPLFDSADFVRIAKSFDGGKFELFLNSLLDGALLKANQ